jgi:hypothetical protein
MFHLTALNDFVLVSVDFNHKIVFENAAQELFLLVELYLSQFEFEGGEAQRKRVGY